MAGGDLVITDEEYRNLKKKVDELEKKVNLLSQQLSSVYMRSDMHGLNEATKPEKRKKRKDTTKYLFLGRQLSKRELVLQCVKQYVKNNKRLSSQKLIDTFPDYIQGSLGVVKRMEDARMYSDAEKRFYFSEEDIIGLKDGKYVICSQWDTNNIGSFIKLAKDMGFEIKPVIRKYRD